MKITQMESLTKPGNMYYIPIIILLSDNKAVPVKFSSSTLDDLTSDKKDEVNAFIKANHLKVKKEPDFLKAITFYNGLSSVIRNLKQ